MYNEITKWLLDLRRKPFAAIFTAVLLVLLLVVGSILTGYSSKIGERLASHEMVTKNTGVATAKHDATTQATTVSNGAQPPSESPATLPTQPPAIQAIPAIVTPNEEERIVLPETTTSFFQGDIRVTVVSVSQGTKGASRLVAKLAGNQGIKRITGEVGDRFVFGKFNEYKVSVADLNTNYCTFNIKRRELTSDERLKEYYSDKK